MHRTRSCEDTWLPGLVALRVRLDQPAGIAAKYKADAKAFMVTAHEQFANDWSDAAVEKNCNELIAKPAEEQAKIVGEALECLAKPDCKSFSECDLAQKEKRWTKGK